MAHQDTKWEHLPELRKVKKALASVTASEQLFVSRVPNATDVDFLTPVAEGIFFG